MIQDIIKNDFSPPLLDNIAINTLAIMEEFRISEIPVVDSNHKFIGMVSESDIINMDGLKEKTHFIKSCINFNLLVYISSFEKSFIFALIGATIVGYLTYFIVKRRKSK